MSGDQAGTISVWYVKTGKLRFRFHNAHGPSQMTALAFDSTRRRLLTGGLGWWCRGSVHGERAKVV